MLPHPDNEPSGSLENGVCLPVPISIVINLGLPPIVIGRWDRGVGITTVPETTVDEDRDLRAGKGDVDLATRSTRYGVLDPVPKTGPEEQPSQCELRLGVPSGVRSEATRDFGCGKHAIGCRRIVVLDDRDSHDPVYRSWVDGIGGSEAWPP